MIINITQHCTLKCPHCMQCAGPERTEHMSQETFHKALDFAEQIGSKIILISGGEPTSHPDFLNFVKEALNKDVAVSVLSNGTFLRDHAFTEKFAEQAKNNKFVSVQISSFKGIYDNYNETHKPNLKGLRLFGKKVILCDETNSPMRIKPLGRARSGKWYEVAKKDNGFPSCTNSCLILAQTAPTQYIGWEMEKLGRFCLPMVSWNGGIRLGESEQCKVIANIKEPLEDIVKKLFEFRPCGGCDSYKWHFTQPVTEQEIAVSNTLWPKRN